MHVSRFSQCYNKLCGEKLVSLCHAVSHGAVLLCHVTMGLEVRYPGHLEPDAGTSNWHSTLHTHCVLNHSARYLSTVFLFSERFHKNLPLDSVLIKLNLV